MFTRNLKAEIPSTPAFVYDLDKIKFLLSSLIQVRSRCGLKILFSTKAFPYAGLLGELREADGFSVSSLFEAKLANEVKGDLQTLHITSPGLKIGEIGEISQHCEFINFNSFSQYQRLSPSIKDRSNIGLRVNPNCSFLDDPRYDPCREYSKLGMPIDQLKKINDDRPHLLWNIRGIHFHTMFRSVSFDPLRKTLAAIEDNLASFLSSLSWINIGGGYLIDDHIALSVLEDIVLNFKKRWDLDIFFEPGSGVVSEAGFLVTSVVDLFENEGKQIAVLDTSVNHLPEVFEYQLSPNLMEHNGDGDYAVRLAGATCLSGDLFGDYRLMEPLSIGDRLVFQNVGAYSLAKAHRFNGYNLPDLYELGQGNTLWLKKRHHYDDYRRQWQ